MSNQQPSKGILGNILGAFKHPDTSQHPPTENIPQHFPTTNQVQKVKGVVGNVVEALTPETSQDLEKPEIHYEKPNIPAPTEFNPQQTQHGPFFGGLFGSSGVASPHATLEQAEHEQHEHEKLQAQYERERRQAQQLPSNPEQLPVSAKQPNSPLSGVLGSYTIQPTLTLPPEEDQSVQAGGLKVHGLKKPFQWQDHQTNYKELVRQRTGDPNVTVGGQDQIREDAPHSMLSHAKFPWQIKDEDLQAHDTPPVNKEQAEIQRRQRLHEQQGS